MNYRACTWLRLRLDDCRLPHGARTLILLLATYTDRDGFLIAPGQRELARRCGWKTTENVRQLTHLLEGAGLLDVERADTGEPISYRIPFGNVVHIPQNLKGAPPQKMTGTPPNSQGDTYIRTWNESPHTCDSCGVPVADRNRFRHENCPPPSIAAGE